MKVSPSTVRLCDGTVSSCMVARRLCLVMCSKVSVLRTPVLSCIVIGYVGLGMVRSGVVTAR